MFGRNVFALSALVLFAFVVCASARQINELTPAEAEQLGLLEEIIEYIREHMYATTECIAEAYDICSNKYTNKFLLAKCTIEYIIHGEGKCAPLQP